MRELAEQLAPGRAAVLVLELQRGVVGDLSALPDLAKAVREAGVVERTASLCRAARGAGVRVIHCHAAFRADRAGTPRNVPLLERLLEDPKYLKLGSASAESVAELAPEPEDLVLTRLHGMSPFADASLDGTLRSDGVETLVASGVSLNVGLPGLAIEAVNRGFEVIVPTDCAVGFPVEYGRDVLRYSLGALARLCPASELIAHWEARA